MIGKRLETNHLSLSHWFKVVVSTAKAQAHFNLQSRTPCLVIKKRAEAGHKEKTKTPGSYGESKVIQEQVGNLGGTEVRPQPTNTDI